MIDIRSVLFLMGVLLSALAVAMALPLLTELLIYKTKVWQAFAVSLALTGFFGTALALSNRPTTQIQLGMREAFLVTSLTWVILSIFAGFPFYFAQQHMGFLNATFEATSALTTTGSTVLTRLHMLPKGLHLWRAVLQWLGGIGIIVMAMIVFPTLRIGGMQLFRSEFSDRSEKILPRVSQIASAILTAYTFFTVLCFLCFYWAGMPLFEAICHAMATVSTGGLSTHDASLAHYNNPLIEMIAVVFMIIGGSTLILYVRLWNGDTKVFKKDSQLHVYLLVMFISSLAMIIWRLTQTSLPFYRCVRESVFTCVSCLTTCGFVGSDYGVQGPFIGMIVFILSIIGGCTGSTAGGIKIFRFQVLFYLTKSHLLQLRRPHGVYLALYQSQKLSESFIYSVFTFVTLYCLCLFAIAMLLSLCGLDFTTCLSGAVASLSNVGPGLGTLVGPHTSFGALDTLPKIILMASMIVGRLELLTILILFMPSFWRH